MNKKKEEKKPRDLWVANSWRYNGSGYQKNKKKQLARKEKHKKDLTNYD